MKSHGTAGRQSRRTAGSNLLYWALAAIVGGAAATYAYVKSGPTLDKGVSPDERKAVVFALSSEQNAKNLQEFGQAMLPNFPIAARLLLTKSLSISSTNRPGTAPGQVSPGSAGILTKIGPGGLPSGPARRISGIVVGSVSVGACDFYDVPCLARAAAEALASAAAATTDVLTHPADTTRGAWKIVTHPSDSISDFGNGLVDVLHAIPGMDEAGELLKDFARTGFGKWSLTILATYGYYVMAPYFGAQLAAVSFSLPGVARGCPFMASFMTETINRAIETARIVLGDSIKNLRVGEKTSEQLNKLLAESPEVQRLMKTLVEDFGKSVEKLKDKLGYEIVKKFKSLGELYCGPVPFLPEAVNKLNQEYGSPPDFEKMARDAGTREDSAAAAYDMIAQTHYQATTEWDPLTGEDIQAHLRKARFQNVSRAGTTASTKVYQDPRFVTVQEAVARKAAAITTLVNPPERVKWVRFYLNKERFAKMLAKAPTVTKTGSIGHDPGSAGIGYEVPAHLPLRPGGYMVEFESQIPGAAGVPELFHYNGVQATGMRQILSPSAGQGSRYRIFIRVPPFGGTGTPRPFQLQNLPGLRWVISRKLSR